MPPSSHERNSRCLQWRHVSQSLAAARRGPVRRDRRPLPAQAPPGPAPPLPGRAARRHPHHRQQPRRDGRRGVRRRSPARRARRAGATASTAGGRSSPRCSPSSPSRRGREGLAEAVAACERDLPGDGEVQRLHYLSVPPKAALAVVHMLEEAGLAERLPHRHGEALRHRPGERQGAQRRAARGLRRGADLPHRPLPGQGGGAEHPGLPLRQRPLRADLEPQLHRPRPDRRARDAGPRDPRGVLRVHRRLQGHGRHAPLPGAGLHGDGAADGAVLRADRRGEGQGLPVDEEHRPVADRARPVRRLPRPRRGRRRVRRRHLHRPPGRDRQLALGRGAVLPADRARSWPRGRGSSRSPSRSRRGTCSRTGPASGCRVPTT